MKSRLTASATIGYVCPFGRPAETMTKPASSTPPPPSFEEAITELERIVADMEGDALSLEQGLARYQRGVTLLKQCRETLGAAEQRILKLEGDTLVAADIDPTTR